uniref:FYVE-type domain-containing protein n=1 Tax=Peronospora matthiolae TaxID=2874970 RepID=A0AAV1V2E5_9STRA
MKSTSNMEPPELAVSEQDRDLLRELAETLAVHNIQQYNTLLKTKDGFADNQCWKELRRKDSVRIYRERTRHNGLPSTPSLLLLGTVDGTLDDVMYGTVATTDEAIRIKSTCIQDGIIDSKVLHELVRPTVEDPFHHVSVKWRLYKNQRDYVSLDTSGIAHSVKREQIGYNISHSVAFAQIPGMEDTHGIERGNMSVCSLYLQKTPTTVECYVRGFFDFHTQNEMVNTMSLQAIATQWACFTRKRRCALLKKLVWRMRKRSNCTASLSINNDRLSFIQQSSASVRNKCALCSRRFGFLGTSCKTCKSCLRQVCARCSSKQLVCVVAPDQRSVLEKKRSFCSTCLTEAANSDALEVAREELASSKVYHDMCAAKGREMARSSSASFVQSAVSRHSGIDSEGCIGRKSMFM